MRGFFAALLASVVVIGHGRTHVISDYSSPFGLDDSVFEKTRIRREIPEECRPPPPPHHHHHHHPHNSEEKMPVICCELPIITSFQPDVWVKCREILHGGPPPGGPQRAHKRKAHLGDGKHLKRVSDDKNDDARGPPPPPSPQFFQEKKECFSNCLFNASGFISNDGMLNEEVLNQKLIEGIANDTKWASTIDPIFKKCVAAAKEANSQSQKTCKPGAAEYMKCMTRELFFNCPNDIWVNNPECNEFKNKLEKCPNLSPPQLPPPHRRARPDDKQDKPSG